MIELAGVDCEYFCQTQFKYCFCIRLECNSSIYSTLLQVEMKIYIREDLKAIGRITCL